MSTMGNRIKQRRLELGMSADDLAAKLGKNRATIYRYESDEIENFPLSILEPLAKALGVTPAYIMGWANGSDVANANTLSRPLLPSEARLLDSFEQLSPEGQEVAQNMVDGLVAGGRYRKESPLNDGNASGSEKGSAERYTAAS